MTLNIFNIKVKLTVLYSGILVASLAVFGFLAYTFLSYGLFHNLNKNLAADFTKARETIIASDNSYPLHLLIDEINRSSESSFSVYNIRTRTAVSSSAAIEEIKASVANIIALPDGAAINQEVNTPDGRIRLYVASLEAQPEPETLLIVERNAEYAYESLNAFKNILFISIPFILLTAGVSGYILAMQSLKPINTIVQTAEKIDPSNMDDRIKVKSNDELGRLAKTLNSLFDRIDGFIKHQRQFTADASHDLRSPLTIIKAETALALRKKRTPDEYQNSLGIIQKEAGRLNSLVDDLLALAGLDSSSECTKTLPINLSALVEGVLKEWDAPYSQKEIELRRQITPGIEIRGNTLHFHRIAGNLLKNALEATPAGGSVNCSLVDNGNEVTLTVADTGIGIPEKHLNLIFNRFYKVDRSTNGNGLGLAIVEETVKIYNGRILAESTPEKGSVFHVFLPKQKALKD